MTESDHSRVYAWIHHIIQAQEASSIGEKTIIEDENIIATVKCGAQKHFFTFTNILCACVFSCCIVPMILQALVVLLFLITINNYGKEASRCKHHQRRLNMVRLFRKDWDKIRSREECGWQALVAADWDRHVQWKIWKYWQR